MVKLLKIFTMTLFADDTTLSIGDSDLDDLVLNTNSELEKIYEWTLQNRLTVNVDKSEIMLTTNRKYDPTKLKFHLGTSEFKIVDSCKFLGTLIDSKLNFKNHIELVTKKISKHVGILYKIRDKLTEKTRLDYYYAFVYPYLSYNVAVWGSTCTSHLHPIIILQKKIVRIINNSGFLEHTTPIFKKFNLLKFSDIHRFNVLTRVFREIRNGKFQVLHNLNTRNRSLAVPTFHRLTTTQHSFSFIGPHFWNQLPQHLREISGENIFKKRLKIHLLESYTT